MSFKHVMLAHGEKVALAATLLLCAWDISSTLGDETIRPNNITTSKIDEQNANIDRVFAEGKHPILKPVPDYIGELKSRFSRPLSAHQVDNWLLVAPDRGPAQRGFFPYVFEAPGPMITAKDNVGAVALTIVLPTSERPAGRRLADGLSASWHRPDEGVTNAATVAGIQIESRAGDAEWKPVRIRGLKTGDAGFISLEDLTAANGAVVADNIEPWVRHQFRAIVIVKATGLPSQGVPGSAEAVLVVPGRLDATDETYWQKLTDQVKARTPATLAQFAAEIPSTAAAKWGALTGNEKWYRGGKSDEVTVQVTADVRFAFSKIGTDPKDPTKEQVKFLVTKLFTDGKGAQVWMQEPKTFAVGKSDRIGGKIQAPNPLRQDGGVINVDLSTRFTLVGIQRNVKRILFYEIKDRARTGSKGRDLEVAPKEVITDVVLLENEVSKVKLSLVKLGMIKRPTKVDAIIYPSFGADLDEDQEFRKNPGSFSQYGLEPAAPIKHQAAEGPLVGIRAKHPGEEDFYTTDTVYYELADGRVVWYEPLNKRVRTWPELVAAPVEAVPTEGAPSAVPPSGEAVKDGPIKPGKPEAIPVPGKNGPVKSEIPTKADPSAKEHRP